jgi:hypothetical protein
MKFSVRDYIEVGVGCRDVRGRLKFLLVLDLKDVTYLWLMCDDVVLLFKEGLFVIRDVERA